MSLTQYVAKKWCHLLKNAWNSIFYGKCEKACCRNLSKKKTIIGVSINNNNSVGTIIGQLVVQKQVCDQKFHQKTVCGRKAFDSEKVNDQNCVNTKRVYDRKENIAFRNSLSKNCC